MYNVPVGNNGMGRRVSARAGGATMNMNMNQNRQAPPMHQTPTWMQQQQHQAQQQQQQQHNQYFGQQPQQPQYFSQQQQPQYYNNGYNQQPPPPQLQHQLAQGVTVPGMNPAMAAGLNLPNGMGPGGIVDPLQENAFYDVATMEKFEELQRQVQQLSEELNNVRKLLSFMNGGLITATSMIFRIIGTEQTDPTVRKEMERMAQVNTVLTNLEASAATATTTTAQQPQPTQPAAKATEPVVAPPSVSGFQFSFEPPSLS